MVVDLNVVIVGAGIAGITCSIALSRYERVKVTVLERASSFSTAGNGIQVPCNAAHVLRHLGILDNLAAKSKKSATAFTNVNYTDGRVILNRDLEQCTRLYGAPWLLVHRADYMDVLLDEARRLGVSVQMGCDIQDVDFSLPSVTLATGEMYKADVIIGSDGIHSTIRSIMHPSIRPFATGSYAYRALFTAAQLSSPSLQHITTKPGVCTVWMGPHANVVFYPLQEGKLFNIVVAISDETFNTRCETANGSTISLAALVREYMKDWDPALVEMLSVASDLVRFPFLDLQELPYWNKGSVTVIGDAAHAMLPHLAQGAAMGVEDALILGTLLGRLSERAPDRSGLQQRIQTVLKSFEKLQKPRTSLVTSHSRMTGIIDHLEPGPGQRTRDAEFAAYKLDESVSAIALIDARTNRELLARKADEVADMEFDKLLSEGGLGAIRTRL